jgi:hypothetical protein
MPKPIEQNQKSTATVREFESRGWHQVTDTSKASMLVFSRKPVMASKTVVSQCVIPQKNIASK